MPIRIAIPVKQADVPQLAKLQEALVDGVQLALADAAALKPALAGLPVACVTTDIALDSTSRRAWDTARSQLLGALDVAAGLAAPCVRVFGYKLAAGESTGAAVLRIGDRLANLLDAARAANVTIAIQNSGSFVLSRDLWQLLETLPDPRVGVCLDIAASAAAGESPLLAIPTLNSRIVHVHVWDHKDGTPAPFGQGAVKNRTAIERLRGIGYDGWITYAPPAGIDLANLDALKEVIHTIKLWSGLIAPPAPPTPPAPAAEAKPAAAKPAPKPATAKPAAPASTGHAGPATPGTPNASSDATPINQGAPSQSPTRAAAEIAKDPTVSAAPQSTSEKPTGSE